MTSTSRVSLDWGKLAPLALRARGVADGIYAGTHRSARRGAGIEFGGHRDYVPGDDLRWLDRRAMMRHDKLLVRQFETETDRTLRLVIDATASMGFRSEDAPGAKLAYAGLVAAALARTALSGGDPVSLDWIGGKNTHRIPSMGGREAFDRLVAAIESVEPEGDLVDDSATLDRALTAVGRSARRGAVIVVLSDLVDLPASAAERTAALSTHGRSVVVARILDPVEATFPFRGPVRLVAGEGGIVSETDATAAREGYLKALERQALRWDDSLIQHGGRLVRATTSDDPIETVRSLLLAAEGRKR